MGYEDDLYRDETANQLCSLMRIYNQIARNLLDFGMDDEDNMPGRVKVRWKERRSVEKKQSDSEAEEGEDGEEINELFKKIERIGVEIELVLENVMTELEVVAELNQLLKPTINKLKDSVAPPEEKYAANARNCRFLYFQRMRALDLMRAGMDGNASQSRRVEELFGKIWQHASRPKPVSMDFVVRPPTQVDPRIRAHQKA